MQPKPVELASASSERRVPSEEVEHSTWWCYSGKYPSATGLQSRCERTEGECNSSLAEGRNEGFIADVHACTRHARAFCITMTSGTEVCTATAEQCERTRRALLLDDPCREGSPTPDSSPRPKQAAEPGQAEIRGGPEQHWCYLRGVGSDVTVAPCFASEATCAESFSETARNSAARDGIEACRFRSSVHCFDSVWATHTVRECYASRDFCVGHQEVVRKYPSGETAVTDCAEFRAR